MPDVSVLTPSYGYGRFIRDALTSVSWQEDVSVEHIIQDAGSADETTEILREFGNRVRWRSEADRGQSEALNRAFALSTGRWIGWLNADEFYLPGGLKTLFSEGERVGADVVYADAVWVDEHGKLIRLFPQHAFSGYLLKNYGIYIPSCAAIFRRSVLGDEPWDADVHRIMDWDLYLRLDAEGAKFHHVPYPASAYRIHAGQITAQPLDLFREDHAKVRARYGIPEGIRRHAYLLHAAYKLVSGAYRRQFIAARMRGADMRWFHDEVGPAPAQALMRRCYGRGA
jgi:glycosyltransferase involved in cell wall biosynthesis